MSFLLRVASRRAPFVCRSCSLRQARAASTKPKFDPKTRKAKGLLQLPEEPVRTRFAPSPTGYLHLGSLRTALFNYLIAKRTNGQFLLRIEDTDQKRTIPDAEERLMHDLQWAGLQWDEGPEVGGPYGPYKQSERTELYQDAAKKLLESGHAYRCFCTPARLKELAELRASMGLPTDYDRRCAHIHKAEAEDRAHRGEANVVRLRVPEQYPGYWDITYGFVGGATKPPVNNANEAYEDPILLKSDGLPTYHLANVVDDHHMKITHVIRGTEWMTTTPKHIALYDAFGWEPPKYAHVGLLTDKFGNKLSKRNMDIDIASFREKGVLPDALVNFAALLGWSPKQKDEIMTLENLVEKFQMSFTKGNTIVPAEKLQFINKQHRMRRLVPGDVLFEQAVDEVVALLGQHGHPGIDASLLKEKTVRDYVYNALRLSVHNYESPSTFLHSHDFLFKADFPHLRISEQEHGVWADAWAPVLEAQPDKPLDMWALHDALTLSMLNAVDVLAKTYPQLAEKKNKLQALAKARGYKHLRAALADGKPGPGMAALIEVLGTDVVVQRLRKYLDLGRQVPVFELAPPEKL